MNASAAAVHERLFTIDTHLDTATARFSRPGWDFAAAHTVAEDGSQCDLPRMAAGGLDAAVFALYVPQAARTPEGFALAMAEVDGALAHTLAVLATHAGACGLARTADDAQQLKREGRRAIFLSLENSYSLGRDPGRVAALHARGVRMIGLTHMLHNDLADASTDPRGPEWGGLSPFGREVVAECNRLGVVLDASHASDDALRGLFAHSRAPVLLSHSGCRAVCDHPRNIGDDLLRDLAAHGGVIQLNALPVAVVDDPAAGRRTEAQAEVLMQLKDRPLTPETRAWTRQQWQRVDRECPNPPATLEDFIRHVEHAVAVAGIAHVGIGCDFDGGGGVTGLNSVADYPNLTAALLGRGWSEADLAKLWGGNTLRVLGAVEAAAR